MRDGIIKADGTSRLLRADLPATYEELRTKAAAGEQPLDVLFNSAGWSQQPTFLNKANLLQDTTAALFGLGGGAVPDDVLSFLGKYNQHWWKRRTNSGYVENKGTAQNVVLFTTSAMGDAAYKFKVSDSVNISSTGVVSLNNPQTVTVSSSNSAALNGKYFEGNGYGDSGIFYGTSSTSWITQVDFGLTAQPVTAVQSGTVGEWGFVQSSDRNAYPDIGTENGYEYIYIGIPLGNAAQVPVKIATGSYTGTGTYGASNPNSLAFDFVPKLLFVARKDRAYNSFFWFKDVTHGFALHSYTTDSNGTSDQTSINGSKVAVTVSGNTVSWFSSSGAEAQLNFSGFIYQYIAIG